MPGAASKQEMPKDEATLRPAVRDLLHALADVSGLEYFQKLSESLFATMGADIAFVGQILADGKKIKTLGMTWDGKPAESIVYELQGTPCQNTVQQEYCLHRSGVQAKYPSDQMLADEKIEGYVGYPLIDDTGTSIGAIIALSRKPKIGRAHV